MRDVNDLRDGLLLPVNAVALIDVRQSYNQQSLQLEVFRAAEEEMRTKGRRVWAVV